MGVRNRKSASVFERWARGLHLIKRRLYRTARRLCPGLVRRLSTKSNVDLIKAAFGFPFGALLGVGLHFAVISRLRIPEYARFAISGIFLAALAFGFALSVPARCIALLTLPTFCGKAGRSYIGTFALAFLIAGPIANLVDNAAEITRSVRCSIELAYNLSSSRAQLRFKPIKDIMKDLQRQGTVIHKITARIKKEFRPIINEVENDYEVDELKKETDEVDGLQKSGVSRSATIEKRYKERRKKDKKNAKANGYERKLDYRCEDVFSVGVKQCRNLFKHTEQKCMDKLSVAGYILCLPLKLSVLCDLVRLVPGATGINCDASNAVNEGFSNGYETAVKAANDMDKNFEVNMQYQVVKPEEDIDRITADEVGKGLAYEFERRQVWFNFVMDLVNTIMTFLFLRVLLSSFSYHKKFCTNFRYDNIYLSSYFRHIDARRHRQRKRTLYPLKKTERKDVIDPSRAAMTGPEVRKMAKRTVKLLLEVFTYTIIIMVDRIIYEAMDIIGRHSRMDYEQTGTHNISLTIYGKGVMGKLVKTLLRGFNKKHAIHDLASNVECLPEPVKMPNEYLLKIAATFLLLWCFIVIESYTLRLRRIIAGYFYPKREKKRILFLYNDMLKKRKGFLRHTRHQVRRNAKERQLRIKTSMLVSLQRQWPRLCSILRILKVGQRKCLICEESYKRGFISCPTPQCRYVYCRECWRDVHRNCYACRRADQWDSDSSSSM